MRIGESALVLLLTVLLLTSLVSAHELRVCGPEETMSAHSIAIAAKEFQVQHPLTSVVYNSVLPEPPWDLDDLDLVVRMLSENRGDVFLVDLEMIDDLVERGLLYPMDDFVVEEQIPIGNFVGSAFKKCTVGGFIYGLPFDIRPVLLYWNSELLDTTILASLEQVTCVRDLGELVHREENIAKQRIVVRMPNMGRLNGYHAQMQEEMEEWCLDSAIVIDPDICIPHLDDPFLAKASVVALADSRYLYEIGNLPYDLNYAASWISDGAGRPMWFGSGWVVSENVQSASEACEWVKWITQQPGHVYVFEADRLVDSLVQTESPPLLPANTVAAQKVMSRLASATLDSRMVNVYGRLITEMMELE